LDQPFPAYRGDEPYVFVCYAHEDEGVVYPEIGWLHEQGINLWYDEGISAGRIWREEIGDAIKGASSVLYYISAASLASDHCSREINFALDQHKNVLPVYLEDVALTTDLEVGLSRVQALHRDQDANYQQHLLGALGQPSETVPPAAQPKPHWGRSVLMGLVAVILFGVGWWYWQPPPSSDSEEHRSIPAIAVLPFVNIGDTEGYFSDGVTDEILNRMIRLRDVRVISRQSSFVYKDSALDIRKIGEQLGADYILQGSVRRSGNTVRIGVHLTDTADGTEMWGSSYDRELTDILRLQDEIAQVAISEFVPNITVAPSARPDVDPVAYDLYLRGSRALLANDPFTAKLLLESAIAIDSDFAEAYGTLSSVHSGLRTWGPPSYVGDDEQLRVLNRALDLDPDNIHALITEALLKLFLEFDVQGSISAFESLIRRFPNSIAYYWYAKVLAVALKTDEMLLVSERIQELDPHSTASALNEFDAHFVVGDFDRARHALDRVPMDPVGPDCFSGRRCWLLHVDISSGRFDAAEDNLRSVEQKLPTGLPEIFWMWLAIERGQLNVARALYEPLPTTMSNLSWYWLPLDVVLSGDTTRTLDEIENPTDGPSIIWIMRLQFQDRWMSEYGAPAFKEAFAALRKEPRYQQALLKYGIDDESLAKIQVHTEGLWD
jgi:TolB-like protein